jgi:hypothetical protein
VTRTPDPVDRGVLIRAAVVIALAESPGAKAPQADPRCERLEDRRANRQTSGATSGADPTTVAQRSRAGIRRAFT